MRPAWLSIGRTGSTAPGARSSRWAGSVTPCLLAEVAGCPGCKRKFSTSKCTARQATTSSSALENENLQTPCLLPVADMVDPLLKERDDVLVVHPVKDFLAIPARLYQAHLPQAAHVV